MSEKPLLSSGDHVIAKVTKTMQQVKPIVRGIDGPVILIFATIIFTVLSMAGVIGATIYGWNHEETHDASKIVQE